MLLNSNRMGAISGEETAYPSTAQIYPVFSAVHGAKSGFLEDKK
jgi:hypothetical protein